MKKSLAHSDDSLDVCRGAKAAQTQSFNILLFYSIFRFCRLFPPNYKCYIWTEVYFSADLKIICLIDFNRISTEIGESETSANSPKIGVTFIYNMLLLLLKSARKLFRWMRKIIINNSNFAILHRFDVFNERTLTHLILLLWGSFVLFSSNFMIQYKMYTCVKRTHVCRHLCEIRLLSPLYLFLFCLFIRSA